ncbi:MAG: hypothetical protein KKD44_09910 [Proteobacteria bacterium]|nr:hypothetical protein [Pseudomonadota bacterium]
MTRILFSRICSLVFLLLVFSLGGCALTSRSIPSYDPGIAEILARVENRNQTVLTLNGLGGITISDNAQATRYRLAWAAAVPDRIRMIVLFSGKPMESIVYDGHDLSIQSHTNAHELYKKRTKNPDLEKLTTLPLRTEQIIGFLSGRIPIEPHQGARLSNEADGGYVLSLLNRHKREVEIIYLDPEKHVTAYEITGKKKTRYRVDLKAFEDNNPSDLSFPSQLEIHQGDRSFILRVDQIQPNPDLPADAFKLVLH